MSFKMLWLKAPSTIIRAWRRCKKILIKNHVQVHMNKQVQVQCINVMKMQRREHIGLHKVYALHAAYSRPGDTTLHLQPF